MTAGKKPAPTIKTIWGLAKSPELQLTSEELHLLVAGYIGKDSLKELNGRETVSYTHLDVYKRQPLESAGPVCRGRRSRGFRFGRPGRKVSSRDCLTLFFREMWEIRIR